MAALFVIEISGSFHKMLNKFRFLALCTAVCAVATVSVTAATKPNVVILLADDLGYAEIDVMAGGSKRRLWTGWRSVA